MFLFFRVYRLHMLDLAFSIFGPAALHRGRAIQALIVEGASTLNTIL